MVTRLCTIFVRAYHFLGSVYCALLLIGLVALLVAAGTFLESYADSHLYAAQMVYGRSYFAWLLWGFFFNILFASTRRWPFKVRHLPFLTTHLGLLMLLAGCLVKHYYGFQGTMRLTEGAGSHLLLKSDTLSLQLFKKGGGSEQYLLPSSIKSPQWIGTSAEGVRFHLLHVSPHAPEKLLGWIHGDYGIIRGFDHPLKVHLFPSGNALPSSGRVGPASTPYLLYMTRTDRLQELLQHLYAQNGRLRFIDRKSGTPLLELPLHNAFLEPQAVGNYEGVFTRLKLELLPDQPMKAWVETEFNGTILKTELSGPATLLNRHDAFLGEFPIAVELLLSPFIVFAAEREEAIGLTASKKKEFEDDEIGPKAGEGLHLFTVGVHGELDHEKLSNRSIPSLIAYDDGFAGYALQTSVPIRPAHFGRKEKEEAQLLQFAQELKKGKELDRLLALPLQMLDQACENVDFAEACASFFKLWSGSGRWVYPSDSPLPSELKNVFSRIQWPTPALFQGALLAHAIFSEVEKEINNGKPLLKILKEMHWPLLDSLQREKSEALNAEQTVATLTSMAQQIFSAAELLPPRETATVSPEMHASLFSLLLRAYHLHPHAVLSSDILEVAPEPLVLETALFGTHKELAPQKKLEENLPAIALRLVKGRQAEIVELGFDPSGKGIRWPAWHGDYLLRFQPQQLEIPYHVRLRSARRLNYPNSSKPHSFESDLLITDRRTGEVLETRISMNHVHETWEGTRFYLSSIAPEEEGVLKRIQLIVNHDPGKYWLTYPGAVILTLGIVLLFWLYRK
jgi:hypothetical protein